MTDDLQEAAAASSSSASPPASRTHGQWPRWRRGWRREVKAGRDVAVILEQPPTGWIVFVAPEAPCKPMAPVVHGARGDDVPCRQLRQIGGPPSKRARANDESVAAAQDCKVDVRALRRREVESVAVRASKRKAVACVGNISGVASKRTSGGHNERHAGSAVAAKDRAQLVHGVPVIVPAHGRVHTRILVVVILVTDAYLHTDKLPAVWQ